MMCNYINVLISINQLTINIIKTPFILLNHFIKLLHKLLRKNNKKKRKSPEYISTQSP